MKKSLVVSLLIVSVSTVGCILLKSDVLLKNKTVRVENKNTYKPIDNSSNEKNNSGSEVDFSVIEECKKAIEESDVNLAYFYPWHDGDKLILNGIDTGISAGNYYSGLEILNLKLDGKNTLFRKKVGFDYYDVYNGEETKISGVDAKEATSGSALNKKVQENCSIKNYKEVICDGKTVWKGELAKPANAFVSVGDSFALINSVGHVVYNGNDVGLYGNGIDRFDGAYLLPSCISDKHIIFDKGTDYDGDTTYSLDGNTEFIGSNPNVISGSFVYISVDGRIIFNGVDCGKGIMPVLSMK